MLSLPWPELHGALTHFPIALLLSAAAFEAGAVALRKPEWRVVSFWLLVATAVAAIPTLVSGWMVGQPYFSTPAGPPSVLLNHRLAAFTTVGLAAALLTWRVIGRDRLTGAARLGALSLSLIVAGVASYTGFLGGELMFGAVSPTPASASTASAAHPAQFSPTLIAAGQRLYQTNGCDSCHALGGQGGHMGPDLTHEGLRHDDLAWQIGHLKAPARFHPGSTMPGYPALTASQSTALGAFLVTR